MVSRNTLLLWMLVFSFPAFSEDNADKICDRLKLLSENELRNHFTVSTMGAVPNGATAGCVLGLPSLPWNDVLKETLQNYWDGKVFNAENGTVINHVLGLKVAPADHFVGVSQYDGKNAIIVQYPLGGHDELREIEPGVYLGRGYFRGFLGSYFGTYFALILQK